MRVNQCALEKPPLAAPRVARLDLDLWDDYDFVAREPCRKIAGLSSQVVAKWYHICISCAASAELYLRGNTLLQIMAPKHATGFWQIRSGISDDARATNDYRR